MSSANTAKLADAVVAAPEKAPSYTPYIVFYLVSDLVVALFWVVGVINTTTSIANESTLTTTMLMFVMEVVVIYRVAVGFMLAGNILMEMLRDRVVKELEERESKKSVKA